MFSANGSDQSGEAFVAGTIPAMQIGAVVVAIGAIAALALRGRARARETEAASGLSEAPAAA